MKLFVYTIGVACASSVDPPYVVVSRELSTPLTNESIQHSYLPH